ncbi:unnamed protein product, partial [Polarella glacialis]
MAEEGRGDHLLAAALRVWGDIRGELKVHEGEALQNGILLPAEDLKKVVKWLQQTVTKFGASAAVADGEDRDKMLQPIAQEVIKSFTAAVGTLLSMRRGAGPSLVKELQVVGGSLAEAIDALGASVGSPSMATHAGKALERVKHLEKMSVQNRAAVRRCLLKSLAQLRDANRELQEGLREDPADAGEDDEEDIFSDDLDFHDSPLDATEKRLVQAILKVSLLAEDLLKEASSSCMPSDSSPDFSVEAIEATVLQAQALTSAVDALAADSVDGVDVPACTASLAKLRDAVSALLQGYTASVSSDAAHGAMDGIQVALDLAAAQHAEEEKEKNKAFLTNRWMPYRVEYSGKDSSCQILETIQDVVRMSLGIYALFRVVNHLRLDAVNGDLVQQRMLGAFLDAESLMVLAFTSSAWMASVFTTPEAVARFFEREWHAVQIVKMGHKSKALSKLELLLDRYHKRGRLQSLELYNIYPLNIDLARSIGDSLFGLRSVTISGAGMFGDSELSLRHVLHKMQVLEMLNLSGFHCLGNGFRLPETRRIAQSRPLWTNLAGVELGHTNVLNDGILADVASWLSSTKSRFCEVNLDLHGFGKWNDSFRKEYFQGRQLRKLAAATDFGVAQLVQQQSPLWRSFNGFRPGHGHLVVLDLSGHLGITDASAGLLVRAVADARLEFSEELQVHRTSIRTSGTIQLNESMSTSRLTLLTVPADPDLREGARGIIRRLDGWIGWVCEPASRQSKKSGDFVGDDELLVRTMGVTGKEIEELLKERPQMFPGSAPQMLTASSDRTLRLWDLKSGQEKRQFTGHKDAVLDMAHNWSTMEVVTASADSTLAQWDLKSCDLPLHFLEGHTMAVNCVEVDWASSLALSGSFDNDLRLWDLKEHAC